MLFNTIKFLEDYNIPYMASHSILTKDFVGLDVCPFCGATGNGKPYFAMRKHSTGTNCWICHTNDFYATIKILTGINDNNRLKDIYKRYGNKKASLNYYSDDKEIQRPISIAVPGNVGMISSVKKYLKSRDFDPEYIWNKYNLKNTTYDRNFRYRIIIPITYNNRVVSYTARDYTDQQENKYMSCKNELEIIPHKNILYGIDNVRSKNVLWIEGPTDVWRIGDGSVSSFGTEWKLEQLMLLYQKFENIFILFDSGEEEALKHAEKAAVVLTTVGRNCEIIELSEVGDPDELFKDEDELSYLKKDLNIF